MLSFKNTLSHHIPLLLILTPLTLKLLQRYLQPSSSHPLLLSLPYSHYVEQARWSLQSRSVHFKELKFPIGAHVFVGVYRILFGGLNSDSSYPGDAEARTRSTQHGLFYRLMQTQPLAMRRATGVPCLVHRNEASGKVECMGDSWSIMTNHGYTFSSDFKKDMDANLGPAVRRLAYSEVFRHNSAGFYRGIQAGGYLGMLIFDVCEYVFKFSSVMTRVMDLSDEGGTDAVGTIEASFEIIENVLKEHQYLGDGTGSSTFGGADISFSSLSGWLILPPNFHNNAIDPKWLTEDNFKGLTKINDVRDMLKTKYQRCWEHVIKCYTFHRV
jgi:hypothetical protein